MNYTYQSFNFRGRNKLRPFYDLIANIAAEEYSHIELVSATINLLLSGTTERADRKTADESEEDGAPLEEAQNFRNSYHFIASGQAALPFDSMGNPWTGANVFSSGNLKLDLLHNFFLECGARANKMKVYEMTPTPPRAMAGFLLVRGGVHTLPMRKLWKNSQERTSENFSPYLMSATENSLKLASMKRPVCTGFSLGAVPRITPAWVRFGTERIRKMARSLRYPTRFRKGCRGRSLTRSRNLSPQGVDPEMIQYFAKSLGA